MIINTIDIIINAVDASVVIFATIHKILLLDIVIQGRILQILAYVFMLPFNFNTSLHDKNVLWFHLTAMAKDEFDSIIPLTNVTNTNKAFLVLVYKTCWAVLLFVFLSISFSFLKLKFFFDDSLLNYHKRHCNNVRARNIFLDQVHHLHSIQHLTEPKTTYAIISALRQQRI